MDLLGRIRRGRASPLPRNEAQGAVGRLGDGHQPDDIFTVRSGALMTGSFTANWRSVSSRSRSRPSTAASSRRSAILRIGRGLVRQGDQEL
jgi:hypothetical protein